MKKCFFVDMCVRLDGMNICMCVFGCVVECGQYSNIGRFEV